MAPKEVETKPRGAFFSSWRAMYKPKVPPSWEDISGGPSSVAADIDAAVAEKHAESHTAASHSDIASAGADIDAAVAEKHAESHTAASHSDIASAGADIDDAVGKRHTERATFGITLDGGGSAITTGIKGYLEIPYGCTITAWTLGADQSGSIKIDIWKDTYANYPPTGDDSICDGHEPEISEGVVARDTDLSDWDSVTVTAGDVIGFNVDSCSAITLATLVFYATKA